MRNVGFGSDCRKPSPSSEYSKTTALSAASGAPDKDTPRHALVHAGLPKKKKKKTKSEKKNNKILVIIITMTSGVQINHAPRSKGQRSGVSSLQTPRKGDHLRGLLSTGRGGGGDKDSLSERRRRSRRRTAPMRAPRTDDGQYSTPLPLP